jgi:LysR family transcriptional regulator, pca operon transcriptional activator
MKTRRYLDQRLRLNQLRAVDVVEAQGSLLRAATVLGISQPALTKTLHEVEDILQLRLFERHSRGVRPTQAGSVFVKAARRVLAELRRVDEDMDELVSPGLGSIVVGGLPVAAAGMLPGVLGRLRELHPGIKVRLHQGRSEELLALLAAGEIDMIVGRLYQPATPDGFHREMLWSEPISVLARSGHPIFESATVDAAALRNYDLVLPTISQRVGQEIEHLLSQLDVVSTAALRSSSASFTREMLHATDMISVMPRLMMLGDLLRGTLKVAALPIPAPDRPAGLILRRDRQLLPAAQAFAACLRDYVADLVKRGLGPITKSNRRGGESDTTQRVQKP